jgi:hypothetical protein
MIFRAIDAGVSVGLVDAVLGGLGGCGSEIDFPLTSSPGSFAMSMSLDYHHESLKCTCYLGCGGGSIGKIKNEKTWWHGGLSVQSTVWVGGGSKWYSSLVGDRKLLYCRGVVE